MTTSTYRVALSFPEERGDLAKTVAAELEKALGPGAVFLYYDHLPELARPNLAAALQQIYHDRSRLVVAFLDDRYGVKHWCGIEWRAIRDLFLDDERSDQVMLLRLTEQVSVRGVYPGTDGLFDARSLGASAIARAVLQRLLWMEETEGPIPEPQERPPDPGLFRRLFDRIAPGLHRALTRRGSRLFPEPAELAAIDEWMGRLSGRAKNGLWAKVYLPLQARPVPEDRDDAECRDPFVRFVHLNVRRILGREEGGDSASPQIASVNRKSRLIRNLVRTLLRSREPLVLLGDPGSGKTLTLQSALLALIRSQRRRVFPVVPLYVRLGRFHEEGAVGPASVRRLVEASCPPSLRRWLADLGRSGRLVVFFDGMDEMSRDRYLEHTAALSQFAGEDLRGQRSLFTCRITDFSPKLEHQRLVVLPFDRAQIARYLRLHVPMPEVRIEGETLTLARLARRLAAGGLAVDARNPFVLFLLCGFLRRKQMWPTSRVELLRDFLEETYERKKLEDEDDENGEEAFPLPPRDQAFQAWARFAWLITERNLGSDVPVEALPADRDDPPGQMREMIRVGKLCGVLAESVQEVEQQQIRFEHHRFQEYFTALWIHENRPEIDWLTRLDAPRWQETMLSLVLMGGAEDGILALAERIGSAMQVLSEAFSLQAEKEKEKEKKKGEKKEEPSGAGESPVLEKPEELVLYHREALLADRVELGARLLRQGERSSPGIRDHLRPRLREAVALLAARGTPITQVKMMRACQNLEDSDLLSVFIQPLRSPVHWVRDQALILVANPQPGRHGTSELTTEMGIDLGTGTLLRRWPIYFRMVLPADARLRVSLLLATLCGLGELVLLLAVASGLFLAATAELPWVRDQVWASLLIRPASLSLQALRTLQTILTLSAAALGLQSRSGRLWAWVLGSVPIGLFLTVVGGGLWQGNLDFFEAFLSADSYIACVVGVAFLAILGLIAHLGTISAYAISTYRWRGTSVSTLLSVAWNSSGTGKTLAAAMYLGVAGFIFFGLSKFGDGINFLGARISDWLLEHVPHSGKGKENFYTALTILVGLVPLGYLLAHLFSSYPGDGRASILKKARFAISSFLGEIGCTILLVGFFFLLALVSLFVIPLFRGAAALVAVGIAVFFLRRLAWMLTSQRELPPGSWNRERWKETLQKANAPRQRNLLLRTHHQTLALKPEEYLELLCEVEPSIRKEPALSAYWDQRDRLEQALRQERQG